MPRIQLSDPTIRNAYRKGLSPSEQSLFDQIVDSLNHPVGTIAWYHHLGDLFSKLHVMMRGRRASDVAQLADAFGPGASLFHKSQRLVKLYPSLSSLQELEQLGTDWTRLTLAFCVPDGKRFAFLRQAQEKGWSIPELKEQLHKRFPTDRKGVGGRRRVLRADLPPEGRVRELVRLSEEWDHIHSMLPPKARASAWRAYALALSENELRRLKELLEGLGTSLEDGLRVVRSLTKTRSSR